MGDTREDRCRSCDAPIKWVRTRAGKDMPVDATPTKLMVSVRVPVALGTLQETFEVRDCYMPHFATCPDAERWRKRKHEEER